MAKMLDKLYVHPALYTACLSSADRRRGQLFSRRLAQFRDRRVRVRRGRDPRIIFGVNKRNPSDDEEKNPFESYDLSPYHGALAPVQSPFRRVGVLGGVS